MELIHAPFTVAQVEALNAYQKSGAFHPYTCGTEGCRTNGQKSVLYATSAGWRCPSCDYTQDWALEISGAIPVTTERVMDGGDK